MGAIRDRGRYTYLLAETRDPLAGNFAWTGQIATYLLFVASTVFVLRHWAVWVGEPLLCAVAFSLHAASGVLFFVLPGDGAGATDPAPPDRDCTMPRVIIGSPALQPREGLPRSDRVDPGTDLYRFRAGAGR